MLSLKLEAIIAGIIFLVVSLLVATIYIQDKEAKKQAGINAQMQVQITEQVKTIGALKDDAATTKANQEALFSSLNDLRVQSARDKNKIVIPAKVLHDRNSAELSRIINEQTKATLKHFEDNGFANK